MLRVPEGQVATKNVPADKASATTSKQATVHRQWAKTEATRLSQKQCHWTESRPIPSCQHFKYVALNLLYRLVDVVQLVAGGVGAGLAVELVYELFFSFLCHSHRRKHAAKETK